MKEENLEIVRAAVIKVIPELGKSRLSIGRINSSGKESKEIAIPRKIRLADVLLTISNGRKQEFDYFVATDGEFRAGSHFEHGSTDRYWDLHNDDLAVQTPETLEFLAQLLK